MDGYFYPSRGYYPPDEDYTSYKDDDFECGASYDPTFPDLTSEMIDPDMPFSPPPPRHLMEDEYRQKIEEEGEEIIEYYYVPRPPHWPGDYI